MTPLFKRRSNCSKLLPDFWVEMVSLSLPKSKSYCIDNFKLLWKTYLCPSWWTWMCVVWLCHYVILCLYILLHASMIHLNSTQVLPLPGLLLRTGEAPGCSWRLRGLRLNHGRCHGKQVKHTAEAVQLHRDPAWQHCSTTSQHPSRTRHTNAMGPLYKLERKLTHLILHHAATKVWQKGKWSFVWADALCDGQVLLVKQTLHLQKVNPEVRLNPRGNKI